MISEEGARALYSGLSPALLRQAVYGTIKYGLYYSIKDVVGGEESTVKNVYIAIVSGAVSASIANPTDVLKVRLQSRKEPVVNPRKPVRNNMVNCFTDIYRYVICKLRKIGFLKAVLYTKSPLFMTSTFYYVFVLILE